MPVYDYRCTDCDSWQRALRGVSSRDSDTPACIDCGGDTVRGIHGQLAGDPAAPMVGVTPPEPYVRQPGLLDAATGRRYRLSDSVCLTCEHIDDTIEVWLDDEGEPAEEPVCSKCGAAAAWKAIQPGHSRFSEKFPYYDYGAGRWFNNQRERRQWMKANGVEEAGDLHSEVDRYMRREDDEDNRIFDEYDAVKEQYMRDPELRRVYRELEDKGRALPNLRTR